MSEIIVYLKSGERLTCKHSGSAEEELAHYEKALTSPYAVDEWIGVKGTLMIRKSEIAAVVKGAN